MTFDWLALQKVAHRGFAARLAAATDWNLPTPDTEWTVRDLVGHVIEEQQWVPYLLAGMSIKDAQHETDPLRDDLRAEWKLYSFAAATAWESGPHATMVRLASDVVTVEDYLSELVAHVTIHTWDLARAIGADERLDPKLVDAVWSVFEPQQDTLAASGLFASPVLIPVDAPLQARLLAITGRDPR